MDITFYWINKFKWWIVACVLLIAYSQYNSWRQKAALEEKESQMETWTNSIGMKFIYLPGGTFTMGDPRRALAAFPPHVVTVSSFWIGKYEVTNEQFEQFEKYRRRSKYSPGSAHPVNYIYWHEAVAFCEWLSEKEDRHYRLPTSAEWEYAARGGLEQKDYPWGNATPDGRAAWGRLETMPVGSYAPNRFGIYDMAGNVEEWVQDWYAEDYYLHSPLKNPQGASSGLMKIARGGGIGAWDLHVASISPCGVDLTVYDMGFRVVMEVRQNE